MTICEFCAQQPPGSSAPVATLARTSSSASFSTVVSTATMWLMDEWSIPDPAREYSRISLISTEVARET